MNTEPDRASSVVLPPEAMQNLVILLKECWMLDGCDDYLFMPNNPTQPFELVRGLGIESAGYVQDKLALLDFEGHVCRWDEVESGVLRAPNRIPGYVGDHFSFVMRGDRVFEGEPPCKQDTVDVTWEDQSFANHDHPDFDVDEEELYVARLRADLERLFPDRRFVIEHIPGYIVTFYEPDGDAPTESSLEWTGHIGNPVQFKNEVTRELVDRLKSCFKVNDATLPTCYECGGMKVVDCGESLEHAGVVFAYCDKCGKRYLAATRTMRYRVGAW